MLKFLLFLVLFVYVMYKLSGFLNRFFGMIGGNRYNHQSFERNRQYGGQRRRQSDGNVTVDYVPNGKQHRRKNKGQGGEYVDYEEVK